MTENKSNSSKILLVSRKSNFSEQLLASMAKLGYSASQCTDSKSAVSAMKDSMPNLIIIDIDLDGADGYSVLQQKAADAAVSTIPVFLMSLSGVPVNMRSVPENSVSEFIMTLHTDVDAIMSKVNSFFGKTFGPSTPAGGAKKILWVEDDKLIGSILSKKLTASGFNLTHAKTGDEAINILSSNSDFDAALLDLILPGMSGFDILQKIRSNPATKSIPVMILSNLSKPSDIERAKILGAQKFLVKAAASLDRIVDETKELCGLK